MFVPNAQLRIAKNVTQLLIAVPAKQDIIIFQVVAQLVLLTVMLAPQILSSKFNVPNANPKLT